MVPYLLVLEGSEITLRNKNSNKWILGSITGHFNPASDSYVSVYPCSGTGRSYTQETGFKVNQGFQGKSWIGVI